MNEENVKTNEDLSPEEERLADLLFDVYDDEDFVNETMSWALEDDIIDETADFIESHPDCTKSDIYEYMASFTEMVWEED